MTTEPASVRIAAFFADHGDTGPAQREERLEAALHSDLGALARSVAAVAHDGNRAGLVPELIGPDAEPSGAFANFALDAYRLAIVAGGVVEQLADRGDAGAPGEQQHGDSERHAPAHGGDVTRGATPMGCLVKGVSFTISCS